MSIRDEMNLQSNWIVKNIDLDLLNGGWAKSEVAWLSEPFKAAIFDDLWTVYIFFVHTAFDVNSSGLNWRQADVFMICHRYNNSIL